ncbi:MAG: hypothetical protein V2A58_13005 [Planctomycetota bacterium]
MRTTRGVLPAALAALLAWTLAACVSAAEAPEGSDFIELGSLSRDDGSLLLQKACELLLRGQRQVASGGELWGRSDTRRLVLTVFSPGMEPLQGVGRGADLREALSVALSQLFSDPRWPALGRLSYAAFVLAVERAYVPVYPRIKDLPLPLYDPFAHTLVLDVDGKRSAITPIDYLSHGITPLEEMDRAQKTLEGAKSATLQLVKADMYLKMPARDDIVQLWRGHSPLGGVGGANLLAAADLAARYVTRSQTENGSFPDVYWPLFDAATGGVLEPEIQAVALFALARAADVSSSDAYSVPLAKGIAYLSGRIAYPPDRSKTFMCVSSGRQATAAASALAIIALDEYASLRKTDEFDWQILKLAAFLESLIQKNGVVIDVYYLDSEESRRSPHNPSYPVEAVPALARVYRRTGDARWLALSEKTAEFAMTDRQKVFPNVPVNRPGWLAMGLVDLAGLSPSNANLYRNWVTSLLRDLSKRQFQPEGSAFLELCGGLWREADVSSSGGTGEGETQAVVEPDSFTTADALLGWAYAAAHWPTAWSFPDELRRAAVGAESFLLHEQFTEPDSFYLKDPARSLGGIRQNWSKCEVWLETAATTVSAFSYCSDRKRPVKK